METTRSTETWAPAPPRALRSPSLRSRLALAAARYGVRPINCALPANRLGIRAGRQLVATLMAAGGPVVPGTHVTQVRSGAVRGEWVRAPGVEHGERALYYVHGSGYVICSARTHRGLASRLSRATGLPVFVVDYRLAPEHRFPAAAEDVLAGYQWLLAHGYRAGDLVIGGDSAGGHLCLDLMLDNDRADRPQPAGAVLFSPLIDLSFELARGCEPAGAEAMASARTGLAAVRLYTQDEDADSPRLRLRIPPGTTVPPLFIQASDAEMLADDARHLRDMAVTAGVPCELEMWPGQIHVFQALPVVVPEAGTALRRAAAFVERALAQSAVAQQVPANDRQVG